MKKKQCKIQFRQGDVYLIPAKIPDGTKKVEDGVIARGEATGHMHRIFDGTLLADEKGNLFVQANPGAKLRHVVNGDIDTQEHKTIEVPEGEYRVVIQEQYTPEGWRQVRD